jgi:diguanylate cyclase (GGDEF)-like protein/PAS domain S-box-containing protein
MASLARLLALLGTKQRLALLVLVTVAPLVLLLSWTATKERVMAIDNALRSAVQIARIAAERQSSPLDEALTVLDDLRTIPAVSSSGGPDCNAQLSRVAANHPDFVSIGVMHADGNLACHSRLQAMNTYGHRALFKEMLRPDGPDTFISGYMRGLVTGKNVIYVARPLKAPDGSRPGVVYASLDLDSLSALADSAAQPGRSVSVIESKTGIVLAHSGASTLAVGSLFPSEEIIGELRAHPAGGSLEGTLGGTKMVFGFAPLHGAAETGAMLLVGAPRSEVLAEVNREMRWNREVVIGVVVLALCSAWAAAYFSQVRPTERLADLARRIGEGDLSARLGPDLWQAPELRSLGDTLNRMADRLDTATCQLKNSENHYRLLAENTGDMITHVGPDGRRVFVSPASHEVLGWEAQQLMGVSPLELAHPDDREEFAAMLAALQRGEKPPAAQYRARDREGNYVWVETQGRPLAGGEGFVLAVRDISRRKHAEDQLAAATRELLLLATTDGLTALHNRRSFDNALEKECARCAREGDPLALLLIDVDHFKSYNDTYGHQAGDDCLKRLSRKLADQARRPADLVARYGGEELAVILPNTSRQNAFAFAERYCKTIEKQRIPHSGSPFGIITVSVGVTAFVPEKTSGPILLQQADEALYRAKSGGRNQAVCIDRDLQFMQKIKA